MKHWAAVFLPLLLLCGCSEGNQELDRAMELRAKLLCSSCSFDTLVTADYGDKQYTFGMTCEGDSQGTLGFQITQPDTIAEITGVISGDGGKLTFHDTALEFPLLADGQVTPVSGPWLLLKTLQSGYLTSAGMDEDLLHLTINDSYEEESLQLDIWLNGENLPVKADILYDGRRILAMEVSIFHIL